MKKYLIISSVLNEEKYLETTIKSVVNQTVRPSEYIIINDGSTDSTPDIISKYTSQHSWIKSIDRKGNGKPNPGVGEISAFYVGLEHTAIKDWDFIVKLDGDLGFEENYFETILNRFESNPKLGIATGCTWTYQAKSGKMIMDRMPSDHTRGAIKMYRKETWDAIGGMPVVLGWDTIDELKAQTLGWETRSYKDLQIMHYKPIGFCQKNLLKRETLAGERLHYLGYHPMFVLFLSCYKMLKKPFLVGGFLNIWGYVHAIITRGEQIKDKLVIKHLRKKQIERLTFRRPLFG